MELRVHSFDLNCDVTPVMLSILTSLKILCIVFKTNLRVNMNVSLTSKHDRNPTLLKGIQYSMFIQTRCFSYIIYYSLPHELSTSKFLDDTSNFEKNISLKSRIKSFLVIGFPEPSPFSSSGPCPTQMIKLYFLALLM